MRVILATCLSTFAAVVASGTTGATAEKRQATGAQGDGTTYRGRSPISQESLAAVRSGHAAPNTLTNLLTCDEELATGGFRLRNSNFPIEALDHAADGRLAGPLGR